MKSIKFLLGSYLDLTGPDENDWFGWEVAACVLFLSKSSWFLSPIVVGFAFVVLEWCVVAVAGLVVVKFFSESLGKALASSIC